MRTLLLFISVSFFGIIVRAQHNHFVYLQTDNKQAFYVKLNEKVYSSSASGYLVIPKLQNGSHKFTVGFPKNEWPNQEIALPVVNKDQGYILKNFDSKGWGLFNMQTLDVIMANSNSTSSETAQVATRTDEFSNTLADVVNTPSIKELKKEETVKVAEPAKPVEVPVEPSPVKPVAEAKAVDSAKPAADSVVVTTAVSPSLSPAPARADTTAAASIRRMNETQTEEGTIVNYLVKNESQTDTVQVILPRDEVVATKEEIKDLPKEAKPVEAAAPKETKVPADTAAPKFIDIELNNPNSATVTSVRQLAEV